MIITGIVGSRKGTTDPKGTYLVSNYWEQSLTSLRPNKATQGSVIFEFDHKQIITLLHHNKRQSNIPCYSKSEVCFEKVREELI